MIFSLAHFPIQGAILEPTQQDYATEAMLLREKAALSVLDRRTVEYARLQAMAMDFQRIARKLGWSNRSV